LLKADLDTFVPYSCRDRLLYSCRQWRLPCT